MQLSNQKGCRVVGPLSSMYVVLCVSLTNKLLVEPHAVKLLCTSVSTELKLNFRKHYDTNQIKYLPEKSQMFSPHRLGLFLPNPETKLCPENEPAAVL